jgi:hypothetical protein
MELGEPDRRFGSSTAKEFDWRFELEQLRIGFEKYEARQRFLKNAPCARLSDEEVQRLVDEGNAYLARTMRVRSPSVVDEADLQRRRAGEARRKLARLKVVDPRRYAEAMRMIKNMKRNGRVG